MGDGLVGTGPTGTGEEDMKAHLKECRSSSRLISQCLVSLGGGRPHPWVEGLEGGHGCSREGVFTVKVASFSPHRRASGHFLGFLTAVSRHFFSRISQDG